MIMENDIEIFLHGSKGFSHIIDLKKILIYLMINLLLISGILISFNISLDLTIYILTPLLIISLIIGIIVFDIFFLKGIIFTIIMLIGSTNSPILPFDPKDIKDQYQLDLRMNKKTYQKVKERFDKEFGKPISFIEKPDIIEIKYSKRNRCIYNKRTKRLSIKRKGMDKKDLDIRYYNLLYGIT
jgi:hypothetical protein